MLYSTEGECRFLASSYRIAKSAIECRLNLINWAWDANLSYWLDWCIAGMEALQDGSL